MPIPTAARGTTAVNQISVSQSVSRHLSQGRSKSAEQSLHRGSAQPDTQSRIEAAWRDLLAFLSSPIKPVYKSLPVTPCATTSARRSFCAPAGVKPGFILCHSARQRHVLFIAFHVNIKQKSSDMCRLTYIVYLLCNTD